MNTFPTKSIDPPLKVFHIISGLGCGGAEAMLLKLCKELLKKNIDLSIVSLGNNGIMAPKFRDLGINVTELGLNAKNFLKKFILLVRLIRASQPTVIQTWMYHADFFGGIAANLAGVKKIIWGIRQSDLITGKSKMTTQIIARINALLSYFIPSKIICCANVARDVHRKLGYSLKKMIVIPNGFDLNKFFPDKSRQAETRKTLGISLHVPVIILAARFHPQKDHQTFFKAAKKVLQKSPSTVFILCGEGVNPENTKLVKLAHASGHPKNFKLLGRRDDVVELYQIADIAVSSSAFGEGFSNAIGEAMACEVPCVVTDSGDSSYIVGDSGFTVPTKSPEELANAILKILELSAEDNLKLRQKAGSRIRQDFNIESIADKFILTYK